MEDFHRGNCLLLEESVSQALDAYSRALRTLEADNSNNNNLNINGSSNISPDGSGHSVAQVYANRALAYLKQRKYTYALQDCNAGLSLDKSYEPLYFRKGQAQFELEEYEGAKRTLEAGLMLLQEKKTTDTESAVGDTLTRYRRAIRKCDAEIASSVDAGKSASAPSAAVSTSSAPASSTANTSSSSSSSGATATAVSRKPAMSQQPATRYEYYQSNEALTVSVLAKNLTPEEAEVTITSHRLRVVLTRNGSTEVVLDKNLYANIDPARSKYDLRKTKIEIVLMKVEPGIWPTLDGSAKATVVAAASESSASSAAAPKGPPRPYASKKDWNAVEGIKRTLSLMIFKTNAPLWRNEM